MALQSCTEWCISLPPTAQHTDLPVISIWGAAPRLPLGRLRWHKAGAKARILHLNIQRVTIAKVQTTVNDKGRLPSLIISTHPPCPLRKSGRPSETPYDAYSEGLVDDSMGS